MSNWKTIKHLLLNSFFEPDPQSFKIMLSVAASAYSIQDIPPTWLLMIAPSGNAKTTLLSTLLGLPHYHQVSEVTPKAFLSGYVTPKANSTDQTSPSLLHRIGPRGLLGIKDFTTILSSRYEDKVSILSALREIHDGSYHKDSGTGDLDWQGRLTIIACATPTIDTERQSFRMMGDRFIEVWTKVPDGVNLVKAVLGQKTSRSLVDIRLAIKDYLRRIAPIPPLPLDSIETLANLSQFTALARSAVKRDFKGYKIVDVAPPEAPTRIADALQTICRCSAALDHTQVRTLDLGLSKRVALDSIPPHRSAVIQALVNGPFRPNDLKIASKLSSWIYYKTLEELEAINLISENALGEWVLSPTVTPLLSSL